MADCNPEIIAEKYGDLVYKICMTRLHSFDRSSVADACQTVFLNYMDYTSTGRGFKDEGHERAWFIRASINCCTNIYKKGKYRSQNEESADISEITVSVDEDFEGDSVYALLAVLPEKIRYAMYLFYVEEYSTEEIAKILKTSGAGIRMRLKRGREILRDKLEDSSFLIENNEGGVADVR